LRAWVTLTQDQQGLYKRGPIEGFEDIAPLRGPATFDIPEIPGQDDNRATQISELRVAISLNKRHDGGWYAVRSLGQGGFGKTTLWVKVNDKSLIERRLAMKDCWMMRKSQRGYMNNLWDLMSFWNEHDNYRYDSPLESSIHREIAEVSLERASSRSRNRISS
jgi:hypothetical protein